ncbi:hypothetical protein ACFQS7_18780 [Dankookia sp. GCM10030260]|uniref:hypothetical protein n=1 Tax=Dankookia sp. GCM10030260 TaxID=3273390 RepID=UPI00360B7E65
MDIARTPSALAARPRRVLPPALRREAASLLQAAVFHLVGGTVLLTLLILGYATKRALGLDLFPGLDMLPDAEIEDALAALVSRLGG